MIVLLRFGGYDRNQDFLNKVDCYLCFDFDTHHQKNVPQAQSRDMTFEANKKYYYGKISSFLKTKRINNVSNDLILIMSLINI